MIVRIGLAVAAGALLLSGCATSTSHPDTTGSTSASPSSSSSGGHEVLPPIEIDGQQAVDAKVGNTLNVVTSGVTKVSTDNDKVLQVSQPHSDGSATFTGGALVVGEGTAKLVVANDSGELYTVDVTAKGALPTPSGLSEESGPSSSASASH